MGGNWVKREECMSNEMPTAPMGAHPKTPMGDSLIADVAPLTQRQPEALSDPLIGTQLGNYEILFILGKGAYGAVYKARDVKLGRFVAIKFLHEFLDTRHEAMFLREAKAIAALGKHPSIVQIFEWSEYQGRNYFVLEYVGSNAAMLLHVNPTGLSLEQATRIVLDSAEGLAYAHKQEIIHRDVKPANILLELEGGGAKLADFGVARFFDPTTAGVADAPGGTPGYMAPEIVKGEEGDARSDLFSLGVTYYELLCGVIPYQVGPPDVMLARIEKDKRTPLSSRRADFPRAVYAIVDRATAYSAAERYQSAEEFCHALRAVLHALTMPKKADTPIVSDTTQPAEAHAAKTSAYKAAEDTKRAGGEKLAHDLLSKGVDAFRDGEAYERLRRYGEARSQFDTAKAVFLEAEEQSNRIMAEIRALKAAQARMMQQRAQAEEAEAPRLTPDLFAAAFALEKKARDTANLVEATEGYQRAEQQYATTLEAARQHGEAELIPPRRMVENARRKATLLQAPRYAPEAFEAGEARITQAKAALPDCRQARKAYHMALERFQEAMRITLERKRLESEKEGRAPITVAGITFVWVPPGVFQMGSVRGNAESSPVHKVTISHGFWISRYPVTQAQWQEIMGDNPSGFRGDTLPVENVSWEDAQNFIEKLNALEKGVFRLPSESEWEYACRAGSEAEWCFGDDVSELAEYAWYYENAGGRTHPVGEKQSNAWGIYDMHGNVCEWCADTWHPSYAGAPEDGSAWCGTDSEERVTRGGSWCIITEDCRTAGRSWHPGKDTRTDFMGLRLCRNK